MKFKCSRERLLGGLQTVGSVVSTRGMKPVYESVLILSRDGQLQLQGTDLDDVVAAAVRSNPIGAKVWLLRFERCDLDDLRLTPPPPTIDLVGVGAQPALKGRPLLDDTARRLGPPRGPSSGPLHDSLVVSSQNRIGFKSLGMI